MAETMTRLDACGIMGPGEQGPVGRFEAASRRRGEGEEGE